MTKELIIHSWAEHHEHDDTDSSLPFLLHPSSQGLAPHHKYFLSTENFDRMQAEEVPALINKWIPGSFRNWLVTIETHGDHRIHLLDTSAREWMQIPLPSLSTFSYPLDQTEKYWSVRRVVFSSDPKADWKNCKILALFGDKRTLYYSQIAYTRWQEFYPSMHNILDIVSYSGLLYAITSSGSLFAIDLAAEKKVTMVISKLDISKGFKRKLKFKPLGDVKFWNHHDHFLLGNKVDTPPTASTFYLVESMGELLLVVRISGYDLRTRYFRVYKLTRYVTEDDEAERHIWAPVEDLNGQMLFVGRNSSLSFSSESHPAGKGDCIYFTDDNHRADVAKLEGEIMFEGDVGVYAMREDAIQYFRGLKDPSSRSYSIWLTNH